MRNFRKLIYSVILVCAVFLIAQPTSVGAAQLKNFTSAVKILENGDAIIYSIFDYQADKGTELYIPIGNLSESKIEMLSGGEIIDGKPIQYKYNEDWNIDASLDEKRGTYGLVKTDNGYELTIGLGDYKGKSYFLEYKVTKFVKQLNDCDMVFWKFFNDNFTSPPQKADVVIIPPKPISSENTKIWGFGYEGEIFIKKDRIYMKTTAPMQSSDYIVGLYKFPKGFFTGGEVIDQDFKYYYDRAKKGSDFEDYQSEDDDLDTTIATVVFGSKLTGKKKPIKNSYKKSDLKGEYYHDVPTDAWYNLHDVLRSTQLGDTTSIINAIFLQFIIDKRIKPLIDKENELFAKKQNISFKILRSNKPFEDKKLEIFYKFLIGAAGDNNILEPKEFTEYFAYSMNYLEYQELLETFEKDSKQMLQDGGMLKNSKKYSEKGKAFTGKVVKYFHYLNDFTLLDERSIREVYLWKDLMLYATMFGISEKIVKNLKNVAPDVYRKVNEDLGNIYVANICANQIHQQFYDRYRAEERARTAAQASGGGGSSSSGGGGGSFGGGSGGGCR